LPGSGRDPVNTTGEAGKETFSPERRYGSGKGKGWDGSKGWLHVSFSSSRQAGGFQSLQLHLKDGDLSHRARPELILGASVPNSNPNEVLSSRPPSLSGD